MKNPISKLGPDIIGFLELRESLGYSRKSYEYQLSKIDAYVAEGFPSLDVMTEDIVLGWSRRRANESQNNRRIRLNVIRAFGKYQKGIGKHAFILPADSIDRERPFNPYLFTDEELARLFLAVDSLPPHYQSPNREHIIPVLFRMLYCCALRPAEPMQLL
jgi:integrase